jgi:hypothetical protein
MGGAPTVFGTGVSKSGKDDSDVSVMQSPSLPGGDMVRRLVVSGLMGRALLGLHIEPGSAH